MQRTSRLVTPRELRRILGCSKLESGHVIPCAGGEWHKDGSRWRFYRAPQPAPGAPPSPDVDPRRWWDN